MLAFHALPTWIGMQSASGLATQHSHAADGERDGFGGPPSEAKLRLEQTR